MTPDTTAPAPPFGEYITLLLLRGPIHDSPPRDAATLEELARLVGRFHERVAATWREHESWLRQAAAERSIRPRFNGRFFGEAMATKGQQR